MQMRIGFSKRDITPPVGTELGGYAGYRPCTGVHDPLGARAVVLEQEGIRYGLVALDLMCADESVHRRIAQRVGGIGISPERLIVSAIHSHSAPAGLIPGEGALAAVNTLITPKDPAYGDYMAHVVEAAACACEEAVLGLESFRIRSACGGVPPVGSERHTGEPAKGMMAVVQIRTESGRNLIIYDLPCHPTVLSAANLLVSADFAAGMEGRLGADIAVFLNGAAGDISTRFTRRESSFEECARMGDLAAEHIQNLLRQESFRRPEPLRGIHTKVTLKAREVETPETARRQLEEATARWQQAEADGADGKTLRILKSYVEGAGVNLEFSGPMAGIHTLDLPVTVFRFGGISFASVPGELFSTLLPEGMAAIAYANGYYRYVAGEDAYDAGYYEAMAAILARGEGEALSRKLKELEIQLLSQ